MIINTNPHSAITVGSKSSQEDVTSSSASGNSNAQQPTVHTETVKTTQLVSQVNKPINSQTNEETSNVSSNRETGIQTGAVKTDAPTQQSVNTVSNSQASTRPVASTTAQANTQQTPVKQVTNAQAKSVKSTSMTDEVSSSGLQQQLLNKGYSQVWDDTITAVGASSLQLVDNSTGAHLTFGEPMKLANGNKAIYLGQSSNGDSIVTTNVSGFDSSLRHVIATSSSNSARKSAYELLTFNQDTGAEKLGIIDNAPGTCHGWELTTDVPMANGEPAFCLQPWYRNPEGINYNPGGSFDQSTQNKLYYIATYGGTGKVTMNGMTWWQTYMAKQVAIWCISDGTGALGDPYGFNINQLSSCSSSGAQILAAAKQLIADANAHANFSGPAINATQSVVTSIQGSNELSSTISYTSNLGSNVKVELVNPPAGAKIVNLKQNADGSGSFQVQVPDTYTGTIQYKLVGSTPQKHTQIYAPSVNNKYQHMLGFSETPVYAETTGQVHCTQLQGSIVSQLWNGNTVIAHKDSPALAAGTAVTGAEVGLPGTVPAGYHVSSVNIMIGNTTVNNYYSSAVISSLEHGSVPGSISKIVGGQTIWVKYHIEKDAPKVGTLNVAMRYSNGSIVPNTSSDKYNYTESGNAGFHIGKVTDSIPSGYHLVNVQVINASGQSTTYNGAQAQAIADGKSVPSDITDYVGEKNISVIYNIQKNAPKTGNEVVKVYNATTKSYETSLGYNASGDAGSSIAKTSIVCPPGYHIVSTTVNDKPGDTSSLLNNKTGLSYGDNTTTTIVYTIQKDAPKTGNEVVKVYNDNTKSYETSLGYNTSGNAGSPIAKTSIVCPPGYHIVSTTVNDKPGNTDDLLGNKAKLNYGDSTTTTIVYTIAKNVGTFNINVYDVDGIPPVTGNNPYPKAPIIPKMSYSKSGNEGDAIGKEGIALPKGYEIVGLNILQNGKEYGHGFIGTDNSDFTNIINMYMNTGAANPYVPEENAAGDIASVSGNGANTKSSGDGAFIQALSKATGIPTADFINGNITLDYYIKRVHPVEVNLPYTTTVSGVDLNTNKLIFGPNLINKSVSGKDFTDVEPSELTTGKYSDYYINKIVLVNMKTHAITPLTLSDLPKVQPDNDQEIIYYISKKNPITISVVGTDGTVYQKPSTTEGKPGQSYTPDYKIPAGQHIVKVTVDGKEVPIDQIPKNYDNKHDIVITVAPTVKPQPKYTNSIVTVGPDGKELDKPVITTGTPGTPGKEVPYVPAGQHIVKVTCNGKEIPVSEIPQVIGNKDNKIVVTVAPNPNKITISVVGTDGKIYEKPTTTEGTPGSPYKPSYPIPEGQHIVKITVDGKEVPSVKDIPNNYDHNHDIVITVAPNPNKITISVVGADGKVYEKPTTTEGTPGSPYKPNYPIPAGQHIVKITVDGKVVPSVKDIPDNYDHNHDIVITVAPNPNKITISVVGTDGQVYEKPTTTEGVPTAPYKPEYKIPADTSIVKVTVDGKEVPSVNDIPKDYAHDHVIVITVAPIVHKITISVVGSNGTVYQKPTTTEGKPGQPYTPKYVIPANNKIIKVTVDGKEVPLKEIPKNYNENHNIVITVAPNPGNADVTVITTTGTIVSHKTYSGVDGQGFNGVPTIPKGYHIVKITQNGKDIKDPKDILTNPTDKIVYTIAKNPSKITIKVMIGNKVIWTKPFNGEPGTTPSGEQPPIPKGYHIQEITQNGKVTTMPDGEINDNPNNTIIYHLVKDAVPTIINHTIIKNNKTVIDNQPAPAPQPAPVVQPAPVAVQPAPVIEQPAPTPQAPVQQVVSLPHTGTNPNNGMVGELGVLAAVAGMSILSILKRKK